MSTIMKAKAVKRTKSEMCIKMALELKFYLYLREYSGGSGGTAVQSKLVDIVVYGTRIFKRRGRRQCSYFVDRLFYNCGF